ncbi:hypothetical protein AXK57_21845 [Tsukamurella pulmonis]|nr:hypothetical protein AXK57_21845 [Tsukamurella pulmonis]
MTEVRAKLSEYTRLANEGKTVILTSNGRAVATLSGPTSATVYGDGAWALVHDQVSAPYVGALGGPFPDLTNLSPEYAVASLPPGYERLSHTWEDERREYAIVWRHLTAGAGVIAVPTARWRGAGSYEFFHASGEGSPLAPLPFWSTGLPGWYESADEFHAAHAAAILRGSQALGIRA